MLVFMWTGCRDYAVDDAHNAIVNAGRVDLALNVSTIRNSTRMPDEVTQVNYETQAAREIQDLKLIPFNVAALHENTADGKIVNEKDALTGMQYEVKLVQSNYSYRHYFDDRSVKIPEGTAAFLCYAKAKPETVSEPKLSEFVNGTLTSSGLNAQTLNTANISFTPNVIHNSVEVVEDDKPSKIAAYLTQIAQAIPAGNRDFFYQFINDGHLVAASSTNVLKLKAWVESWAASENLTVILPDIPEGISDYPSDIHLPDGAAAVKWNTNKFEPQPVTTTEANINSLNRFIYPAELWYYANSRIKTDDESRKDDYNKADWADVLATYETDNGVMEPSVHSVAIKDPLSYAVGCLQVGLVVSNSLKDADETEVSLSPSTDTPTLGTFPLTAVFVSGQYQQKFDFTPNVTPDEKIVYDPDPERTGITMGDSKSSSPTTENPTKWVNTLVFQTQDNANVRFALEFENNGEAFQGYDGKILSGTKFYLVGTIDVPSRQEEDYQKRVFTKNYITQGTVRISSLAQAYPYLPDLLDPRLEIGIKLIPKWIQSTTTNVPL